MSILTAQSSASKRSYRLGKRAEGQEQTRQRIVEAAVELHGTLGPARTSVVQIANRAGVQRHTFYAHFPDEQSLMRACSGLALERDPLPDVEQWAAVGRRKKRLRHGLAELYAWYGRNEQLTACVLRDAEFHVPTREAMELRMAPTMGRAIEVLGENLGGRARSLLAVSVGFYCWRTLSASHDVDQAAALMADAIVALDS